MEIGECLNAVQPHRQSAGLPQPCSCRTEDHIYPQTPLRGTGKWVSHQFTCRKLLRRQMGVYPRSPAQPSQVRQTNQSPLIRPRRLLNPKGQLTNEKLSETRPPWIPLKVKESASNTLTRGRRKCSFQVLHDINPVLLTSESPSIFLSRGCAYHVP